MGDLCFLCSEDHADGLCICGRCLACQVRFRDRNCFCILPRVPEVPLVAEEAVDPRIPDFFMDPAVAKLEGLEAMRRHSYYDNYLALRKIPPVHILAGDILAVNLAYHKYLYDKFFESRNLSHLLHFSEALTIKGHSCLRYDYVNPQDNRSFHFPQEPGRVKKAAHGTAFPFLRSICLHGGLERSIPGNVRQRAANYGASIYVTPRIIHTAFASYAVPQNVFADGIYHKAVIDVIVDELAPSFRIKKANEWLAEEFDIKMVGVYLFPNTGAKDREPRMYRYWRDTEPNC
jgi:hypothetical protein